MPTDEDVFFLPLGGDRWQATRHTTGPWGEGFQHGGPPSALLARAVETAAPREDTMVARLTVELLGPVPVGELELTSQVTRPGRSVEYVEATLSAAGRAVARATAWRILRSDGVTVVSRAVAAPPLPATTVELDRADWVDGYLSAMEWRFASGALTVPGPATVWARMRIPLIPGEQPSPLQRVMALADSGNGASSELDLSTWHFINPELTVHLHREAIGEWICLDASTTITTGGVGLATSVLSDTTGLLGVGAQSLLVARRPKI